MPLFDSRFRVASLAFILGLAGPFAGDAQDGKLLVGIPDPAGDGWQSEAFSQQVGVGLNAIRHVLLDGEDHPEFRNVKSDDLRPDELVIITVDETLRCGRWKAGSPKSGSTLAEALVDIGKAFSGGKPAHLKFKHYGVDGRTTEQYFAVSGPAGDGFLEINATWRIRWNDGEPLVPKQVELLAYEEVRRTVKEGSAPLLFEDATGAVLPADASVRDQYSHGTDYWRQRIEVFNRMFKFGYNGIAVGDADGDGRDDLFSCQNGGLPNRMRETCSPRRAAASRISRSSARGNRRK